MTKDLQASQQNKMCTKHIYVFFFQVHGEISLWAYPCQLIKSIASTEVSDDVGLNHKMDHMIFLHKSGDGVPNTHVIKCLCRYPVQMFGHTQV